MDEIEIIPPAKPIRTTVRVPGSKSITNRALPLAALCEGEIELTGVLFADDTWQMINALQTLGYSLQMDQKARRVRIFGLGKNIPGAPQAGTPHGNAGASRSKDTKPPDFHPGFRISCGNSGTTIRFLAAMLSLAHGTYTLDGIERMRQRPIDQLVDQLRVLGADIAYEMADGFPPIRIASKGLAGGGCQFSDAKSSQYISAVLMAAPYAENPVTVGLLGPVTSEPYVTMTLRMMQQFGVTVAVHDQCGNTVSRAIQVPTATYRLPGRNAGILPASSQNTANQRAGCPRYVIEPDASNASYFLAAAAIVPGSEITIEGLHKNSLQGDVAFADVLGKMGATVRYDAAGITVAAPVGTAASPGKLMGIDLDMNHIPDMVQTLAVVALFADGPTTIRNVWNLRVKETDRLAALETELQKLGAKVETTKDSIRITPPTNNQLTPASIATYDDHRMAMAFAIAGLRARGIRIQNPHCTAKTYPEFFTDLAGMTATNT